MKIKNVQIGDKFTKRNNNSICEVVDIQEVKSLVSGEIVKHVCIAKEIFLGQDVLFEVPFASVILNKTKNK